MANSEEFYHSSHKKATMQQAPVEAWTGQPYPAYKDSGVEWLGKVPEHWEVRCLGTFGRFLKGSGGTKADETKEGVPCVRYGDLYTRHQFHIAESKACIAPHRVVAYTPVSYGDVLFAGSGETLEEIGKSAVNLIRGPAVCGGDVIIFRPTLELDAEFIGWSMDCRQAASQKAQMGRGITVMHIYSNDLKYLAVALPPLPEQHAIAHFLDHANQRIQHHIHAKEKLIKLLEEQKQVIIHQAVTGQIDVRTGQPYPAYKDSGVEWLGEVPEHWEVGTVKRGYDIKLGKMLQPKANSADDIEVSYLKAKDVQWFSVQPISAARMWASPGDIKQFSVSSGDLLVCEGGEGGRCGILTDQVSDHIIQNSLHRVRSRYSNSNTFLQYTMRAVAETGWFAALNNKATIAHFTYEKFSALHIPFPSSLEQHAIAHFLNHANQRISASCAAVKRQINLLHEYRTRLIADVVTGKLDVREAAAELPGHGPSTTDNACQDGMALAAQVRSRHP